MGTAGAKVTVASKLPMAIEMQLCTKRIVQMKNGNNAWTEEMWAKDGKVVTINGTAYPNGQIPEGMPDRPQMSNGAALTFGVDKDFFDAWMAQNKDTPMVKNNLVFAATTTEGVKAKAREHKAVQSGLQPLTPDNDRRMPKKLGARTAVAEADRQPAEVD